MNGSSIKVSWNKIKNADGYYIYKTVKSTRRPFPEVTIASGNTTSWIDKDIKKGVKYEYQVIPYIYVDGKAISNMGSDYVLSLIHIYSEVIAQLIGVLNKGCLEDAVLAAVDKMKGAYAFAAISKDEPGKIVAFRKDAPLIAGLGKGCNFIACLLYTSRCV